MSIPLLGPLFGLLVCLAKFIVGGGLWALVTAANLVIAAIGAAVSALLSLLPVVPLPEIQMPPLAAWFDTFLPLHEAIALLPLMVALLLAWHLAVPLVRKLGLVS